MRRLLFGLLAFFGFGVAGYALTYLFGIPFRFMDPHFFRVRHLLYGHVIGGAVALLAGPWQFSNKLRARRPRLHRALGYTYASAILVGGIFGLILAPISMGGILTHLGFGLLAVAWMTTTGVAVQLARQGNYARHQAWMMRSFALSLAAVTLRNYLPLLSMKVPFLTAYAIVSWLCWVPNLVVAEWLIAVRTPSQAAAHAQSVASHQSSV
jgi:uncharacterized membrane protein